MKVWRLIPFTRLPACENMALDEAIFRENQHCRGTLPTLRLYTWLSPAVSIGRFQAISHEVDVEECRKDGIQIVRRPTGGKAVLHQTDVTYAVIAEANYPPFPPDIMGTYRVISACIARGLALLGVETNMSPDRRPSCGDEMSASCFSSSSAFELLANGRKLCGSAQVRSQGAFLQHGSLLTDFDPFKTSAVLLPHCKDRKGQIERLRLSVTSISDYLGEQIDVEKICGAFQKGFEQELDVRMAPGELTSEEEKLKARLLKDKYTTSQWNMDGISAND